MGHSRPARQFGIATTLALAVVGLATPAPAAEPPQLELFVPRALSIEPAGKERPSVAALGVYVGRTGTQAVKDVTVAYDGKDLAGIAALGADRDCTADGTVISCKLAGVVNTDRVGISQLPRLTTSEGAKIGSKGVLHITLTSPGAAPAKADVEVYVGGPSLKIKTLPPVLGPAPGSVLENRLEITNEGSLPANRVILSMTATEGLAFEQPYGNCESGLDRRPGEEHSTSPRRSAMVCTVDTVIAPGQTVRTDALKMKVGPTAYEESAGFTAHANQMVGDAWFRTAYDLKPGSGPRLTLGLPEVPVTEPGGPNIKAGDVTGYDSQHTTGLDVTADNTADFEALATWSPAGGGSTGTLSVGLANHGPATVTDPRGNVTMPTVDFTLPAGVKVGKVPDLCNAVTDQNAAPGSYRCFQGPRAVDGLRATFDFALEVPADARARKFAVALQNYHGRRTGQASAPMPWDKNPANDLVVVSLGEKVTGVTPPGTPGGTTTPPAKGGSSTAATPHKDASGAPSATGPAGGTSAPTGPLASTGGGSDATPIAVAGAAAVALGLGLVVVVARRRRAGSHR